jgi:transmembrane 9 superfamily protein 2/4
MIFLTIIFSWLGFKHQEYRGTFLTYLFLFFVFMGIFAGYYSARYYKMFRGVYWLRCTLLTAILYPSIIFSLFLIVNIVLSFEESSGAVNNVNNQKSNESSFFCFSSLVYLSYHL